MFNMFNSLNYKIINIIIIRLIILQEKNVRSVGCYNILFFPWSYCRLVMGGRKGDVWHTPIEVPYTGYT